MTLNASQNQTETARSLPRLDDPISQQFVLWGVKSPSHITRHDKTTAKEKSCEVLDLRHDATLVVSDLTSVVSRRAVDPHTSEDFPVWSCYVVSCNLRWT